MTGIVVKADSGLIWLIVGIFWVVAQIAGAAAKKKQPPRPTTTNEPGATSGDPFADLLRRVAGTQTFEVPQPEYEEEQEEALAETETMPVIEPLRRETMGQSEIQPAPAEAPEIDIRPKMSAFRNSVPTIRMPAMNLSFQGSETSVRKVSNLGDIINPADKHTLRRAMLSHIIFSKPKAFEQ